MTYRGIIYIVLDNAVKYLFSLYFIPIVLIDLGYEQTEKNDNDFCLIKVLFVVWIQNVPYVHLFDNCSALLQDG